ncbi:MAG TPA: argininosuccinate lyase, partial [Micavibrio sp.]|nr:argininosuccinate lyase [Micavibrio sp.]
DFALEFLSCASICSVHLSRLAEELILWSSSMFDFISLSDSFTTGSSIMPQKRNPDAAELIRAKIGRIAGSWNTLLIVQKALPLAYNKDLQEDKEPVFDAFDTLLSCLQLMTGMISDMSVKSENMAKAADLGFSTATQLADWLVQHLGLPFRQAHHVTGQIVKYAEAHQKPLKGLSLEELQDFHNGINDDIYKIL